tara:strand:+ start:86 stop:3967 length:3882 start_codon:yes stop_codon:yes gene_type:complete
MKKTGGRGAVITGVFQGIGMAAVYAGAQALRMGSNMVSSGIQTANSLIMSRKGFEALTGSEEEAKNMMEEIMQFAKKSPFPTTQIIAATRRLNAFGMSGEESLTTIKNVSEAVAGMGGNAEQIQRVTRAMGQMLAKGKLSAEEMTQQLAEAGIQSWDILATHLGKTKAEVMELGKQGKLTGKEFIEAFNAEVPKRYGGSLEKMAETFQGRMSELKDTWELEFGMAMEGSMDQINKALPSIIKLVEKLAKTMGPAIGEIMTSLATTLVEILPPLLPFIKAIAEAFADLMAVLAPIAGRILKFLVENLMKAADVLIPFITKVLELAGVLIDALMPVLQPILDLIILIADEIGKALAPVFEALKPVLKEVGEILSKEIGTVLDALRPLIKPLAKAFGQILEAVVPLIPSWVELHMAMMPLLVAFLELAVEILPPLIKAFTWLMTKVLIPIQKVIIKLQTLFIKGIIWPIKTIYTILKKLIKGDFNKFFLNMAKAIGGALWKAMDAMQNWFVSLPGNIWNWIKALGGLLVDAGKELGKLIFEGIKKLPELLKYFFLQLPFDLIKWILMGHAYIIKAGIWLIKGLIKGIIAGWKFIIDFFTKLPDRIKGFFKEAGKWLWNAGDTLIHGLWAGIQIAWDAVVQFFIDLPGRVVGFFDTVWDWLWEAGGNLISGLKDGIVAGAFAVWNWFQDLPGNIASLAVSWWEKLKELGKDILKGILEGITGAWNWFWGEVKKKFTGILDGVKSVFGMSSPSKEMAILGGYLPEGMKEGLEEKFPRVTTYLEKTYKLMLQLTEDAFKKMVTFALNGMQALVVAVNAGIVALAIAMARFPGVFKPPLDETKRAIKAFWDGIKTVGGWAGIPVPPIAYHSGGRVGQDRGREVPAVLKTGEYVLQQSAVDRLGVGRLDMLNAGHVPRFHEGGHVSDEHWKGVSSENLERVIKESMGLVGPALDNAIGLGDKFASNSGKMAGKSGAKVGEVVKHILESWIDQASSELSSRQPKGLGWVAIVDYLDSQGVGYNISSAFRPGAITATGNRSMHGFGRAVDLTGNMGLIFDTLRNGFSQFLHELIYSPAGGNQWYRGGPHYYGEPTRGDHFDHVHASVIAALGEHRSSDRAAAYAAASASGAAPPHLRAMVQSMAAAYGWTGQQFEDLAWIIDHESSWDPTAANPNSSARGLFQKMTSIHGPLASTLEGQIQWGLNYIRNRYGSPSSAKAFWLNNKWYDHGGWLPQGFSMAYNGTGAPEPVGEKAVRGVMAQVGATEAAPVNITINVTQREGEDGSAFAERTSRLTAQLVAGAD